MLANSSMSEGSLSKILAKRTVVTSIDLQEWPRRQRPAAYVPAGERASCQTHSPARLPVDWRGRSSTAALRCPTRHWEDGGHPLPPLSTARRILNRYSSLAKCFKHQRNYDDAHGKDKKFVWANKNFENPSQIPFVKLQCKKPTRATPYKKNRYTRYKWILFFSSVPNSPSSIPLKMEGNKYLRYYNYAPPFCMFRKSPFHPPLSVYAIREG
ncbi:hypothetical protein CEXT_425751 [Caerostris extrusa]|uniref:Uncharacterized protein n=1 Tax=Caerostris extrusa TaxID=172846 RepID=A0AAV4XVR1_CAEEX|nr:hypothetical protein CEXT_425751 [Caerostris extrusa]